jgi:molybdopterin synthase sulfur carrier subunit
MNVFLFGVLADIVKTQRIDIAGVSTTEELIELMEEKYPEIKNYNYQIAVNQKQIEGNCVISENDEIALLPPFAGG